MNMLYTIGHSNHPIEKFLNLLQQHSIKAVCDVRSQPYSKHNPQYKKANLQKILKENNIEYVFLGKELGPRTNDQSCYINDKVQYHLIAETELFKNGIERLRAGIEKYKVAIMCAEKDPVGCHRSILICRYLSEVKIKHIHEDGSVEAHEDLLQRLIKLLKLQPGLFDQPQDLVEQAYDIQSEKIAYVQR